MKITLERSDKMALKGKKVPGSPALVSLFCGAGGLDVGFQQSGFRTHLALDISEAAIETHKSNKLALTSVVGDLKKLGSKGLQDLLESSGLDLDSPIGVIGGPPCQGFSRANNGAIHSDPRNLLARSYVNAIAYMSKSRPIDFVVFENVLGIKDAKNRPVYDYIVNSLKRLGFTVHELELLATNFGVPQVRKRVFVVAERYGVKFEMTDGVPRKSNEVPSVKDAISGLPEPAFYRKNINKDTIPFHPNHWTMVPRSKRFSTPVSEWRKSRSFKLLDWNSPSPTIAFGNREIHIHPSGTRRLSIFEAMRIQGFPDAMQFHGNFSEQVEQVSNAVPPPLARYLAGVLMQGYTTKRLGQGRSRAA